MKIVDPYGFEETLKEILEILKHLEIEKSEFGIVIDEFEIRKGLVYIKGTGRLIGLLREWKEKDVFQIKEEDIEFQEANHVLQFF